jgi:uncharacterized damage-inducible protein DinB
MLRTLVLMCALTPTLLPADDVVAAMYLHEIDLVENDVISLAKAMPAGKFDFVPTQGTFAGARSFGEQIKHLATMIYMTAAISMQETSPYGPGKANNGPETIRTKDEIISYLQGSFAYARKAAKALTTANHLDTVKTYFGPQTRAGVLAGVAFHSFDHYGQMVVYARLNGIAPPSSVPARN